MNLSMIFTSLVIALFLLADPSTSTCGECEVYVQRTGSLPDTTLDIGTTWNIIITEQFARSSDTCYYDYDSPTDGSYYNAPRLYWKIDGSTISLRQNEDTLYIKGLKLGTSKVLITASSYSSQDPNVVNQHLKITVK